MRPVIFSIAALLMSAALLQLGNGLQFTLLPVRADLEAFNALSIAGFGTSYFTGFLLGCVFGPVMVGQVGHIRVLAAVLALTAATVLVYALFVNPPVWILGRAVAGFCMAVAYMAIESWLNERAPQAYRGAILSIYALSGMSMLAVGQLLLNLYPVQGFQLFSVAALLIMVAAVPVTLTRAPAPVHVPQARLRIASLLSVSRVAVAGSIAVGLVNSAFWALGPVFAARSGMSVKEISWFMAMALAGGALMMWPIGALSDRVDRRTVAGVIALGGALAAAGLVWATGRTLIGTLAFAYFFGAFAFTLYPICLAHASDHARPGEYVTVSGGLLFLFGAASLVGPVIAGLLVQAIDVSMLFVFSAAIHGATAAVIFVLQRLRPPTAAAEKETFTPVPRTTQAAYQLHEGQT